MQRGSAGGYGYDKTGASLEAAADNVHGNDAYYKHDVDLVLALIDFKGGELRYAAESLGYKVYNGI